MVHSIEITCILKPFFIILNEFFPVFQTYKLAQVWQCLYISEANHKSKTELVQPLQGNNKF